MVLFRDNSISWCVFRYWWLQSHYSDVIMGTMASQITSLNIVYSTIYSGADQRKHQSSASLAFVRGIHQWPVNSPHKWPVRQRKFPFDDIIMLTGTLRPQTSLKQCDSSILPTNFVGQGYNKTSLCDFHEILHFCEIMIDVSTFIQVNLWTLVMLIFIYET